MLGLFCLTQTALYIIPLDDFREKQVSQASPQDRMGPSTTLNECLEMDGKVSLCSHARV